MGSRKKKLDLKGKDGFSLYSKEVRRSFSSKIKNFLRTRESSSRASSQVRDNLSYYSRSSEAKSRSSTPSEWSSGSSYNPSYSSNQDYYRGKVKSIYERDPLFSDFMDSLPPERTHNLYNAGNLTNLKEQFQYMVQDRWGRKQLEDPSVRHDTALQTHGWSNYLGRSNEAASEVLGRKHSRAKLEKTTFNLPNITIYHK